MVTSTLFLMVFSEKYSTACKRIMEVMKASVMVTTSTAAQETSPFRVKFKNPALIILFNSVININMLTIITTNDEHKQIYLLFLVSRTIFPFSIVITLLPTE